MRAWTPPTGPLGRLSSLSGQRAAASRAATPLEALARAALAVPAPPSFRDALVSAEGVAVVAEVKRRSPSKGAINDAIDAGAQVRAYAAGGAVAFSILTEPSEFGGALDDLRTAAAALARPCIRKDFLVDEIQLAEARLAGAASALLIARALPTERLHALVNAAVALGLEPLVEIRDEWELDDAVAAGARVIGVNNRDLETLVIDDAVSARLLPRIPREAIAVYESGVASRADVERAAAMGADAVLVGSALSAAADPAMAARALVGVARRPR
ncbi:MAG: indole-3-glycerol-phosphate synthase [Gemmatimonadaceae bacterium]|nr:indole-3-glycerol-phosphate synthase [Gemmatimonadaceae bacterium]